VHADWPPIKPFLRSALQKASAAGGGGARRRRTLFVKVYMEGVPIGRKLDLLLLDGYDSLLIKLCHMFKTPITCKYATNQLICISLQFRRVRRLYKT
jgi:auxin-responsive protein IAA